VQAAEPRRARCEIEWFADLFTASGPYRPAGGTAAGSDAGLVPAADFFRIFEAFPEPSPWCRQRRPELRLELWPLMNENHQSMTDELRDEVAYAAAQLKEYLSFLDDIGIKDVGDARRGLSLPFQQNAGALQTAVSQTAPEAAVSEAPVAAAKGQDRPHDLSEGHTGETTLQQSSQSPLGSKLTPNDAVLRPEREPSGIQVESEIQARTEVTEPDMPKQRDTPLQFDLFGNPIPEPTAAGKRPEAPPSGPTSFFDTLPKDTSLDDIRNDIGDCTRCRLSEHRNRIVFGEGNPKADLVFVGEGPGADEDASGRPFVGRAGKLLDKMIEAIDLRREEVYICNVVKCRPPENRTPERDEVATCEPFLFRQLALIRPKVIVALGAPAFQCLMKSREGIMKARGQWRDWNGIRLIPTYHPAYLLRSPDKKRESWEDLKKVREYLATLGGS
jgi:uracil-DNA glycosylase family 4